MKNKVLLIQPHSDDILFSASKYLFNAEDYSEVVLLTVEKDEKRNKEDSELAEFFGVKYKHLKSLEKDNSYYHFYKDDKKRVFSFDKCDDVLKDCIGKEKLKEIKKELISTVEKYKAKGFTIVCCLGVGHPMHYFVRKCIEDKVDIFYRDFPHSYKRKTSNCVSTELADFKLKEKYQLADDIHQVKWELAYQVYKTQRSLLFFEKGYVDKKLPEEYYVKK